MKIEIDTSLPLKAGFRWVNEQGQDKWDNIKYERLSDYCYDCGRLGHTYQTCVEDVVMSDIKHGFPLYGSWLLGVRPGMNN